MSKSKKEALNLANSILDAFLKGDLNSLQKDQKEFAKSIGMFGNKTNTPKRKKK